MGSQLLVGVWTLESCIGRDASGAQAYPLGERPDGLLIYTASGQMSATLGRTARPPFQSPDRLTATDAELRAAFESFDAYAGTYEVDTAVSDVIHHVCVSTWPNATGIKLRRHYEIEGDRLALTTPPTLIKGREITLCLVWRRVA